ncbi:MAG: hypothetical protein O3C25_03540 [Chloroflexi bacterium]|nr:hypothetical protein [Chloroflexota bacterium]
MAAPYPFSASRHRSRVLVCTSSGTFEGYFHYAEGDRVSDALRSAERYLLLSDVAIQLAVDLGRTIRHAPFLLISVANIEVIVPLEEPEADEADERRSA